MSATDALSGGFKRIAALVALYPQLESLCAQFFSQSTLLCTELPSKLPFELITQQNKELLERFVRSPEIILPVYGSGSCGKSTLFNALLGARVMPSGPGHVTARVCMLKFCVSSESRIEFHTLSTVMHGSPFRVVRMAHMSLEDVTRQLQAELRREGAPSGKKEFSAWVQTVIKVFFPFPLLQTGVALVDLPGHSRTDNKAVQKHIRHFLRAVNPPGVILMYSNPTFSDAEMAAYRFLLDSIPSFSSSSSSSLYASSSSSSPPSYTANSNLLLLQQQQPSIFLCSSRLDIETILFDASRIESEPMDDGGGNGGGGDGIETEDRLIKESTEHRYKLVSSRNLPLIHFPASVTDCPHFACVNALDYITTTPDDEYMYALVQRVFSEFVRKLDSWVVSLQQRRFITAALKIALGCDQMFRSIQDVLHSTQRRTSSIVAREAKEAREKVDELLFHQVLRKIRPLLKRIPGEVEAKSKEATFVEQAIAAGMKINLGMFEGADSQSVEREAFGAFQSIFSSFIQHLLWMPILDQVRDDIIATITDAVQMFAREATENNRTLLHAIQANLINPYSFSFEVPAASIAINMTFSVRRSLKMALKGIQSPSQKCPTINGNWKREAVLTVLSLLKSDAIDQRQMEDGIAVHLTSFTSSMLAEIDRLEKQAESMQQCKSTLEKRPGLEHYIICNFRNIAIPTIALLHATKEAPQVLPDFQRENPISTSQSYDIYETSDYFYKLPKGEGVAQCYYEFTAASGIEYIPRTSYFVPPTQIWRLPSKIGSPSSASSFAQTTLDSILEQGDTTVRLSQSDDSIILRTPSTSTTSVPPSHSSPSPFPSSSKTSISSMIAESSCSKLLQDSESNVGARYHSNSGILSHSIGGTRRIRRDEDIVPSNAPPNASLSASSSSSSTSHKQQQQHHQSQSQYVLIYDKANFDGLKQYEYQTLSANRVLFIAIALASVLDSIHRSGSVFGSLSSYAVWIPADRDYSDDAFLARLRIASLGLPPRLASPYPADELLTSHSEMYAFGNVIREFLFNCSNPDQYPIMEAVAGCFCDKPEQRSCASEILAKLHSTLASSSSPTVSTPMIDTIANAAKAAVRAEEEEDHW